MMPDVDVFRAILLDVAIFVACVLAGAAWWFQHVDRDR